MTEDNLELRKRVERKEMDSTPQEGEVMARYIDLRANAYKALMSNEERKGFSQNLIDMWSTP